MSALARMLRAGSDDGRVLEDALDGLAEVFGDRETAWAVGRQFTCAEADRVAWVLIVSRHADAAVVWLQAHADGDTSADLHGGDRFDARRYITGGRGVARTGSAAGSSVSVSIQASL